MPPQILTVTLNPALDIAFDVERMKPESKLRTTPPITQPGGGGINVARAATRLGADVCAMWLGGGHAAHKFHSLLAAEGVAQHHVAIAGEVRMSIHVEETSTTDMYRFVLPGPELSAAEAGHASEAIERSGASYVVLSGSLPRGVPPELYAHLAAKVSTGTRVIIDTNEAALAVSLTKDVFLAKPNKNELGRILGRELKTVDEVVAAAREVIASRGVHALAVSMAEDGLVLVTADAAEHVRAPKVEMVSAVGAGDSTVAGIAVGLARGLSLRDAARLGVAAGTAAVLTPASDLIRREDVERLYEQIA